MSASAATSQISATRPLNTSSIPQIHGGEILTSCASMSLPGTYAGQAEHERLAVKTFPSSTIDDFVYRGFVLAFMLLLALVIPFRAFGQGAATAPVFSPAGGGYHTVQTVTLSDSTPGAAIYYTTNGTAPTTQSTLYTGAITVGSSENFQAVAIASGGSLSPVAKSSYTIILPAAVPVPSLAPGAYGAAQTVSLSDATPNATIYYTVTGAYPNTSSPIYTTPFTISKDTALQALATAPGYESSPVLSDSYTIAATAPAITPASGTYTTVQTATLSTPTPGAYILYTTDGSTPTSSSKFYNGPFSVSANETVNAVAFAANYTQSAVASMTYTVILPAAAPSFSPPASSFVSPPNVTIKSVTAGAIIYYTTDGSTPTTGSIRVLGPRRHLHQRDPLGDGSRSRRQRQRRHAGRVCHRSPRPPRRSSRRSPRSITPCRRLLSPPLQGRPSTTRSMAHSLRASPLATLERSSSGHRRRSKPSRWRRGSRSALSSRPSIPSSFPPTTPNRHADGRHLQPDPGGHLDGFHARRNHLLHGGRHLPDNVIAGVQPTLQRDYRHPGDGVGLRARVSVQRSSGCRLYRHRPRAPHHSGSGQFTEHNDGDDDRPSSRRHDLLHHRWFLSNHVVADLYRPDQPIACTDHHRGLPGDRDRHRLSAERQHHFHPFHHSTCMPAYLPRRTSPSRPQEALPTTFWESPRTGTRLPSTWGRPPAEWTRFSGR